jgi:hypothetical protein
MELSEIKIPQSPRRNRQWTKNKKIIVVRHSDGRKKTFDTIDKVAEDLHINKSYVKYALNNPNHICHHPDRYQTILSDGKLNTKPKPLYDFIYEEDDIVKIVSQDALKESRTFSSHYKCKLAMGFSSSTYQLKIKNRSRNNVMKDKDGREWEIIPLERKEF